MASNTVDLEAKPQTQMADIERAPSQHSAASDNIDPKYAVFVQDQERRKKVEKKLKRKLDMRCSLFFFIYIMNYLDRNNIVCRLSRTLPEAYWLLQQVKHGRGGFTGKRMMRKDRHSEREREQI